MTTPSDTPPDAPDEEAPEVTSEEATAEEAVPEEATAEEASPEVMPEADSDLVPMQAQRVGNSHRRHVRNFLECVKSRQQPTSDIEIGHRSSSTAILGNIAYRTGRRISWDGENEEVVGDAEAGELLAYHYRDPWTL